MSIASDWISRTVSPDDAVAPIESCLKIFIHGAALSRDGKPIIAIPFTAARGKVSSIVPVLKPGAGVVTTRGHIHWVVTEFGAANLHGKTPRERGELLISIAPPDFRSEPRKTLDETRHFIVR